MSWFGNNFNEKLSSIKDQVTTFTKVLTEDEEDLNDDDIAGSGQNPAGTLTFKQQIAELENRLQTSETHNAAKYNALLAKYKKAEEEICSLKSQKSNDEWETIIGQPGTSPHSPSRNADIVVEQRLTYERDAHQSELSQIKEKYETQIQQLRAEAETQKSKEADLLKKNEVDTKKDFDEKIKEATIKFQTEIEDLNSKLEEVEKECENFAKEKVQKEKDLEELDAQHQLAIEELLKQKKELSEELSKARESISEDKSPMSESAKTPLDSLMDKNQLLMTEIGVLKENEPTKLPYSEADELRVKEGIISQLQMQLEKANMDIEMLKGDKKLSEDRLTEINHKTNVIKNLQAEMKQLKNYHEVFLSDKDSIIYLKDLDLGNMTEELEKAKKKIEMLKLENETLEASLPKVENNEQLMYQQNVRNVMEHLMKKLELQDPGEVRSSVSEMMSEVARLRCERDNLHDSHQATVKEMQQIQLGLQSLENEKEQLMVECEELRDQIEDLHTRSRSPSELSQSSLGALPTIEEEKDSELAIAVTTEEEKDTEEDDWKTKATKLSIQMRSLLDAKLSAERQVRDLKLRNEQLLGEFHKKRQQGSSTPLTLDLTATDTEEEKLWSYVEKNDSVPGSLDTKQETVGSVQINPDIDSLRSLLITKTDQIDDLRQDIEEIGQIFGLDKCSSRTVYITAKKEHAKIKDEANELKQKLQEKTSQCERSVDELTNTQKINQHLEEQIKCVTNEKVRLEEDLVQTCRKLASNEQEVHEKTESFGKLQASLEEQMQKLTLVSQNESKLQEEVNILRQQKDDLNQQIETLSNEHTDMKATISKIGDLQEEIEQKNNHIGDLKTELTKLQDRLDSESKMKEGTLSDAQEAEKAEIEKNALEDKLAKAEAEIASLTSQRDTLVNTSTQKHQEAVMYYQEIEKLSARIKEKEELHGKELQEKSKALAQMEGNVKALELKLNETQTQNSSSSDQLNSLRNECQSLRKTIAGLRKERDHMVSSHSSLNQQLQENSKQMQSCGDKEKQLTQECHRLREHLISVEDSHTKEALQAAERENTLKQTIAKLHDKMSSHSTLYTSNNQKYATELSSLKEQHDNAISERDDLRQKLQISEEVSFQNQEALKRLQQVLQDFQKSQSRDIASAVDRERRKLEEEKQTSHELRSQVSQMQTSLMQMEDKLKSRQTLEGELQSRDDTIVALKSQVHAIQQAAKKSQDQVAKLQNSSDGKIDKHLLRNLVVGYLATPSDKQHEVMRIIAQVLDFSNEERHRTGIDQQPGSWLSSVANFLAPPPSNLRVASKVEVLDHSSLSQAFIRFLEDESTAQTNMKLPAVQMAEEVTKKAQKSKAQMASSSSKASAPNDAEPSAPSGNAFLDTANIPHLTSNAPVLVTPETTQEEPLSEPKFLKNLLESPKEGT